MRKHRAARGHEDTRDTNLPPPIAASYWSAVQRMASPSAALPTVAIALQHVQDAVNVLDADDPLRKKKKEFFCGLICVASMHARGPAAWARGWLYPTTHTTAVTDYI